MWLSTAPLTLLGQTGSAQMQLFSPWGHTRPVESWGVLFLQEFLPKDCRKSKHGVTPEMLPGFCSNASLHEQLRVCPRKDVNDSVQNTSVPLGGDLWVYFEHGIHPVRDILELALGSMACIPCEFWSLNQKPKPTITPIPTLTFLHCDLSDSVVIVLD